MNADDSRIRAGPAQRNKIGTACDSSCSVMHCWSTVRPATLTIHLLTAAVVIEDMWDRYPDAGPQEMTVMKVSYRFDQVTALTDT